MTQLARSHGAARQAGCRAGGQAQLAYLEAAFTAVTAGAADALCTAPVSKAQVQLADRRFVGHTEWLEARTGAARSVMMLPGARCASRSSTIHLAARQGAEGGDRGAACSATLHRDPHRPAERLRHRPPARWRCRAMIPHAGEDGSFGDEETRLVSPASLPRAPAGHSTPPGPYPADSVFFRAARGEFDAVLALYHDQGLIPVKLIDALMAIRP